MLQKKSIALKIPRITWLNNEIILFLNYFLFSFKCILNRWLLAKTDEERWRSLRVLHNSQILEVYQSRDSSKNWSPQKTGSCRFDQTCKSGSSVLQVVFGNSSFLCPDQGRTAVMQTLPSPCQRSLSDILMACELCWSSEEDECSVPWLHVSLRPSSSSSVSSGTFWEINSFFAKVS